MRIQLVLSACIAATALIAGGSGCARTQAETRPTVAAHPAVGTQFTATIDKRLSTLTSRKGDRFTLRVDADVLADDGSVLLHAGETIDGHVVEVDAGREGFFAEHKSSALMRIAFDGADVAVIAADGHAEVGLAAPDAGHDTVLRPPIGPKAAIGGGPRDTPGPSTAQLVIPAGTRLTLMVTGPLR